MENQVDVDFYNQQGYLFLPGIISAQEALSVGQELRNLIENYNREATWQGQWLDEEKRKQTQLLHLHSPEQYHARFGKLLFDDRILDPISQLIGDSIELHHTKGFVKPPEKGSPFPPHQDYPFFPHQDIRMLAIVLYLSQATEAMGCIRVWPRSHLKGPQTPVTDFNYLPAEDWPLDQSVALAGKPGDAVIFNYMTVHDSGPNLSNEHRVTILLQLRHTENRPINSEHPSFAQGLVLKGKKRIEQLQ